ncbi:MAG: DNA-directed RNA polymerase subunit beta, partial [Gemmatimonadaceae bacterium]
TRDIPNVSERALANLDENGVVRVGTRVGPGDILVGKIAPKSKSELTPEEKLLHAIFGRAGEDVKNDSLEMPAGEEGVVIGAQRFSRRMHMSEEQKKTLKKEIDRYEKEMNLRAVQIFKQMVAEINEVTGQVMVDPGTRQKVGQSENADVILEQIEGFAPDWVKGNKEAKEQGLNTYARFWPRVQAVMKEKQRRMEHMKRGDELPSGVLEMVKVYVATKRQLSVGDKMAGRHGNKGVIARIVPEEDMPFLEDGSPVDILLNPLGVPSRMNVGQILETHLGWAARVLGFYAKTPVFQGANEREIGLLLKLAAVAWVRDALDLKVEGVKITDDEIRGIIADVKAGAHYGERVELLADATIDSLGARGVSAETRDVYNRIRDFVSAAARELAERDTAEIDNQIAFHSHGAGDEEYEPAARAQYKAAAAQIEKKRNTDPASVLASQELPSLAAALGTKKSEVDVDAAAMELMRLAGISAGGKVRLRDGRTGETFANPVTVGEIYMLKLSHLVDDKIHARSIGPYSLVTQQPLAGKAQFGGQRFGEMEVWALEAYGAAHTLQEILTVKSDDVNGRSRVYEAIVKGQNLPEPGIPESFNVLVQELKALGIHVSMGANATSGYGLGNIGSRNGNGNGSEG